MKTAIIMSKEEAMALPLKKRPLNYRVSSELYHLVFEKVGYASMCWQPKPSSEVFDAEKASTAAVDICFAAADECESGKWTVLHVLMDAFEKRAAHKDSSFSLDEVKRIIKEEADKYLKP